MLDLKILEIPPETKECVLRQNLITQRSNGIASVAAACCTGICSDPPSCGRVTEKHLRGGNDLQCKPIRVGSVESNYRSGRLLTPCDRNL